MQCVLVGYKVYVSSRSQNGTKDKIQMLEEKYFFLEICVAIYNINSKNTSFLDQVSVSIAGLLFI